MNDKYITSTGWFGVPGKTGGMVHLVSFGKPACGTKLAEGSRYQWCSPKANLGIVECGRCKKIGGKVISPLKPLAKYLCIDRCPAHLGSWGISVMDDKGGTRLTPVKCCGRWDTVRRWKMSAEELRRAASSLIEAADELEKGGSHA